MSDPYVYPGTTVLKNKLDIQDAKELETLERQLTHQRREQLLYEETKVARDIDGYRAIHRQLFQDVYEWAGEIRDISIAKGNSMFAFPQYIHSALEQEFSGLRIEAQIKTTSRESFVEKAADHIAELNAIHPFREGNGRTMRVHLELLARESGYDLDTTKIDPKLWNEASISAMSQNNNLMKQVISEALEMEAAVTSSESTIDTNKVLSEHKAQFMNRVEAEMGKHEQFAGLSDAERFSMAATVAIEQARQTEKSEDGVLCGKGQKYTFFLNFL